MKTIQSVIYNAKQERAKVLNLSGLDIDEIPSELFELKELEELNLSNNNLQEITSSLLDLENLKVLNLHSNKLLEIPNCIYNLKNIDSLILTANPLRRLDPKIGKLTSLRRLAIAQTDIETIPPEIGNLIHLHSLNLGSPLGNGKIFALPKEFGNLSNLLILYLAGNKLEALPQQITQLKNLFLLDLSGNSFEIFPHVVTYLLNLQSLDLGGNVLYGYNNIDELPKEIGALVKLRNLNLSYNSLSFLPNEIYMLKNLETLNLRANKLTTLSNQIVYLSNLKYVCLDQNELENLPSDIGNVSSLRFLEASENKLTSLPLSLKNANGLLELDLGLNNIQIPLEISAKVNEPQGIIQYYFKTHQGNFFALSEAKLIVIGQGGVGKTSIARMLIWDEFFEGESKTEGISIHKWGIADQKTKSDIEPTQIKINLWDFGGQEIMHATHQFFLTKRSLYLLVLDSRLTQEENRVEYWLKIIQSFGGESPVLIVGNKIDQHPLDIDRTGLQKKYPNIVGILETSAATGVGIEELKAAITEQISNLPHVRDLLPETWFTVKAKLEGLGHASNFITHDKYLDLCAENEISDETSQRTLIGFLHDLGVVLHFQDDPRLEALGILNPQWVTNGVYKILNSHALFQNKGALTVSMLNEILLAENGYPRDKRLFVVDMMKKFELCYDIDGDTFLVPDLLPKDEPYTGEWGGALTFKYAYGVLPSSIMSRFIVKMKDFVHQPSTWRSGTILKKDGNTAFVKADFEDKTVTIKVQGSSNTRRDTLSLIRGAFEMIHKSVVKLEVTQQVPHPQYPNLILDYEELIEFERERVKEFPRKVDGKVIKINVREMLNGVESESQRREKNVVINNYYNASDGGIIVGRDFSGNLASGNYNKINSAEIDPVLKDYLLQLDEAVDAMLQKLPAEQATEVAEDFGKLADEAIKPNPNQKWYSVSIEGLIKAAENLDKLGEPVINLSRKVLTLLTNGIIK